MVLAAMALSGTRAGADVTSDRPGSVVVWPKVIADGTRDTIITLTNTRNEQAQAHCVYTNAIGICRISEQLCTLPGNALSPGSSQCPGGPADVCDLAWQLDDFDVILTRQQPTMWRVSTGRVDNPLQPADAECDNFGDPLRQSCPGFFLIGQVRPPVQPFRGELRCIQVAPDGTPIAANGLKGEAIIEQLGTNQISQYNSINVRGTQGPSDPSILELNGVDPAEVGFNNYNACPEALEMTHYALNSDDLVAGDIQPAACSVTGCPVTTEITVTPCRVDYEHAIPTAFQTFIQYTNEFEQTLSITRNLQCWTTFTLDNLGFTNVAGSIFQRTRITNASSGLCIAGDADEINTFCTDDSDCGGAGGVCAPPTGILSIFEEFHSSDATPVEALPGGVGYGLAGSNAANVFEVDLDRNGTIAKAGACRGDLSTPCVTDSDCTTGKCRTNGVSCTDDSDCMGVGNFCDLCMNDEITLQPDLVMPLPTTP
jgi:hypothetical protein